MPDQDQNPVLATYGRKDVVEQYESADYLTQVEQDFFARYCRPGMSVLDLGVGGGRTSAVLSEGATEYIGVDIAPEMVDACRRRFPALRFEAMDAADLSAFGAAHFDLVVFSFNGMGHFYPDSQRHRCLAECRRVLKPGGLLIFSLHNAAALFFRVPRYEGLSSLRPILGSLRRSFVRLCSRILMPAYWRGRGYLRNNTHGGMVAFLATPDVVAAELQQQGFELLEVQGDGFPRTEHPGFTRWYYYVART